MGDEPEQAEPVGPDQLRPSGQGMHNGHAVFGCIVMLAAMVVPFIAFRSRLNSSTSQPWGGGWPVIALPSIVLLGLVIYLRVVRKERGCLLGMLLIVGVLLLLYGLCLGA